MRRFLPARLFNGWFVVNLGLTLAMGWWALILALPWPTFPTSASYREFVRICPSEAGWAMCFALVALVGIWGLLSGKRGVRVGSSIVLGVAHGLIAILSVKGNPAGTGTGIYVILMLQAYWMSWLKVDRLV